MNIVFLSYNFYGYEKEILNELKKISNVKYINLNISIFEKIFLIIAEKFIDSEKRELILSNIINIKIKKKMLKFNKNIDCLFVLGINFLNEKNFSFLEKNYFIKEKKIYLWDTLNQVKHIKDYKKWFNKIYSFDKKESIENNFIYRPNFYSKRIEKKEKIIYDIFFIGAYSPERLYFLQKITKNFECNFIHLYLNFGVYLRRYFFNPEYKLSNFRFFNISKKKYNLIMSYSNIVIDLLQFKQSGVTQRTLDALYLNKKIITNNSYIKNYDFYNPNNILIINSKTSDEEIKNFKKKKYVKISKKILAYYSIENWIKDVLITDC